MRKLLFLIVCCSLCIPFFYNTTFANDDYPKTIEERKMEEMGSLAGPEGLTFRPGKIKNESTKTQISHVNKYLWQAAIDALHFIPLASSDATGGIIITEWHSPEKKPNFRFKIHVFIKDNIISPEALEVKVFEQKQTKGSWIDNENKSNLPLVLEDKILRKARELYINTERKE